MTKDPTNDHEEMQVMMKIALSKARACDQLFEQTGVEEDHLNAVIRTLEEENDQEVMELKSENMEKMSEAMLKWKAKNAGLYGTSL